MKYIILFGLVLFMVVYMTRKANADDEVFEVSLKVYTSTEIHQMFPDVVDQGKEVHYIWGWIRAKRETKKDPKHWGLPRIIIWNNFYQIKIDSLGAPGYEKSHFLIPVGYVDVGKEEFKYRIK